jgi:hypothetical protein
LGRSAERKDQRKGEKELRKEEKTAERGGNKSDFQKAKNRSSESPTGGSASAAPSVLPFVSASPSDLSAGGEKKRRTHKHERPAETSESASPSPPANPQ